MSERRSRSRSDRRYRSDDRRDRRSRRGRRGRRTGLLDFWQNMLDDTMDFLDDSIDRVRDDDWDDVEDDVDELREAVAALSGKLDRLLAQSGVADIRDKAETSSKSHART
ncbi:MAG: hypothetical protein ACRDZ7_00220 [Acidimicrobiia bacterium]